MSIVCGIDFTAPAQRAARAAARLAVRMQTPLHLVYSVELSADALFEESRGTATRWAKRHLEEVAVEARKCDAQVEIHIVEGPPDETLQEVAKRVGSQLITVAALGHRRPDKWTVGSHAERLAQHAHVPVLVVRDPQPFEDWALERRPLRLLLGADASQIGDAALHWIAGLRKFGPCELTVAHLYWPPTEFQRFGLGGVRSYVDPDPIVTKALANAFEKRIEAVLGQPLPKVRLLPHLGRVGDRLAAIAEEEAADLIVVGPHDRRPTDRIVHGSVSHQVLHAARMSVACVPAGASETVATARPRNLLIAIDFSTMGSAGLPIAYGIAADGGTVHLVHVSPDESHGSAVDPTDIFPDASVEMTKSEADTRQRLMQLIPRSTGGQAPNTHVHVLRSNDPASAICQAAERLDVDLICLGTHGRSKLTKVLLGSVSTAVLAATKRPVLITRAQDT